MLVLLGCYRFFYSLAVSSVRDVLRGISLLVINYLFTFM